MVCSKWLGLVLLGIFLSGGAGQASARSAVSAAEFALYMDWINGRQDPRLKDLSDSQRMRKIAVNLGVRVADIVAAVSKVTPVAATIAEDTTVALRRSLASTPLQGRILDLAVDAGQSHVIAHIKWRCGPLHDLEQEAAYAGWASAAAASVVATTVVWCVNTKGTKLFSARAANSGLMRITKTSIPRFAKSRYIRIFEGVKTGAHR